MRFLSLAVFLFFLGTIPALAGSADGQEQHAHIRLLAEQNDINIIKPGQTFSIAIEQNLTPGWHTYWKNPGDSGTPMTVQWTLPDGFSTGELRWPVPHTVPYGPLMNYGYEGRTILLQDFTTPNPFPPGPLTFEAKIEILVCMEICIPERGTYTITLNTPATPVDPLLFEQARETIPQDIPAKGKWREDSGNFVLVAKIKNPALLADLHSADMRLFPEEWGLIENAADQTILIQDDTLQITQKRGPRPLSDVQTSRMVLVLSTPSGPPHGYAFEAAAAQSGLMPSSAPGPAHETFFHAVILAFLGGLILNLMPCVFPVLSIKALSSIRLAAHHPWRARLHGLAYTAGIVSSFLCIAGILLFLRTGGAQIGWGFQLQDPLVVISLAFLLFTIGLNLLGLFDIILPIPARLGRHFSGQEGIGSSFLTGILATLVATPCTAPFMGAALGYAITQPAAVSLAVFVALGLGLALPFLALSFLPFLQKALPKPGAWMDVFRQFLAFPMFASAAWLVWVLAQQSGSGGVLATLCGAIGLSFAFWALRIPAKKPRRIWMLRLAAAAGFVAALESALWVGRQPPPNTASMVTSTFGLPFSERALAEQLQGPDPVFVEMTAAWCITCKVNHGLAIDIPATRALMERKNIRYMVGDWTNADPEITKYLDSFGRNGVPLYVYYGPDSSGSGKRPDPVVLPQILTPGLLALTFDPETEE